MKILVVSFGPISEEKSGYFNLVNESIRAIRKYYDADSVEFVSSQDLSIERWHNGHGRFFVQITGGLQGGPWLPKLFTIFLNSIRMYIIIKKYDVILIETSVFLPYALAGRLLHKKVIFATHGMILEMARHNKKRPVKYFEQLFQAYFLDSISSLISDIVLVTSKHDKEIAIKSLNINEAKIRIRPVAVNRPDVNTSTESSKRALKNRLGILEGTFTGLIIGDYAAEQNRKALDFLFSTEHMFPENLIVLVIGKTYGTYTSTRKIRVLGYVENINDYYEIADGLILPLSTGMGIKTKIIESMAHGLRIFTTPIGILGIDLDGCEGIYIYNLNDFWEYFKHDMDKIDYSKKCQCLINLYSRRYSNESLEYALKAILFSLDKHYEGAKLL